MDSHVKKAAISVIVSIAIAIFALAFFCIRLENRLDSLVMHEERREQRKQWDPPVVSRFEGKTAVEATEKYAQWQNGQKFRTIVSVTALNDQDNYVIVVTHHLQ
jgi:hypothetical protein